MWEYAYLGVFLSGFFLVFFSNKNHSYIKLILLIYKSLDVNGIFRIVTGNM